MQSERVDDWAAGEQMKVVVPFTLLIVFVLLYLTFKRFDEASLVMATLPFAMVGGIWLLYLLEYNLSVASAVGFIAWQASRPSLA